MTDKIVHVDAYVKDDGTQVKEHYRGAPSNTETLSAEKTILEGNVSVDYIPENIPVKKADGTSSKSSGFINTAIQAASIALNAISAASKLKAFKNSANTELKSGLENELQSSIEDFKTHQKSEEEKEKQYLEKMVNAKNQNEYSALYKNLTQQKLHNKKTRDAVTRVEYAVKTKDYDTVINELQNYQSDFKDVVKKTQQERPLNVLDLMKAKPLNISSDFSQTSIMETSPKVNKIAVDDGMFLYNTAYNIPDAKELWKASSHDFNQSKSYIQKNGSLIYSVSELPSDELQRTVSRKLQEQLGINDTLGVILKSESTLSQAIAQSKEIKEHFVKYKSQLLNGKIIKHSSTYFSSNKNLSKALGHADILYTHIDKDNNLYMLVFDTYDFNKGDGDWKVRIANAVQEAGYIRNYYTLNVIIIPFIEWQKWL